jgi:type III pantothenate kinase
MILDIDLGNTRLKWRETMEGARQPPSSAIAVSAITNELTLGLSERPRRVRVASVRGPHVDQQLISWCNHHFGLVPEFARSTAVAGGVTNGYDFPQLLGVDRWIAMLAAYQVMRTAVIIFDFGTAITADAIDESGCHLGGVIGPGLCLMSESLRSNTGLVRSADQSTRTISAGRNTNAAVAAGVLGAAVGLAKEVWTALAQKSGARLALVTGGDAIEVAPQLNFPTQIAPDLVLDGLAVAVP